MVLKGINFNGIISDYLHYHCPFALLPDCSWFSSSSGVSSKYESLADIGIERLLKVLICGILFSLARSVSL